MRAFIFSLDAFVAFTLALVAIYSLIFFSSIPSSYYFLLTQAHYLARDILYTISTSDCISPLYCSEMEKTSVLDAIVFMQSESLRKSLVDDSIGKSIPNQFGYTLETSEDDGKTWSYIYDTKSATLRDVDDKHATEKKKLSVSSQVPVFVYAGAAEKDINPYLYTTCMDDETNFVITCDEYLPDPDKIVPPAGVKLLRLTIFI
jgi:hypothetical protein